MKNKVYIEHSPHKLWKTYIEDPPISYSRMRLFSNVEHVFNRVSDLNKKQIIEFEHILHLTGESRNYQLMLDRVSELKSKLEVDTVLALITPSNKSFSMLSRFFSNSSKLEEKTHVVHPAVKLIRDNDFGMAQYIHRAGPVRLLFIGNKFWGKGGHIAIGLAEEAWRHGLDVELKFVCGDIPQSFPIPPNVQVHRTPKLSRAKKESLYNWADFFLFPVLHDSFGVHLECLEHTVPMLTTDIYDKCEIVSEGVSGHLFKPPFELYDGGFGVDWLNWNEFVEKVQECNSSEGYKSLIHSMLDRIVFYSDRKSEYLALRYRMASDVMGRFSLDSRNKKLKDIYENCIQ